ncbi:hypothetical protein [Vreelandella boliviensis]|uniref:Uncharacterized protein n=1 Tax=Vreelandella boliviensis LC1 TaxID=1072583 RepID=A0A7U9C3K8_9GAMM|nr:hypothetical protein [Halomonas boliviensis]EHJ94593.1 hypothetical protein KUC_1552 [Halomonas boliviensis LC1]
MLPTYTKIPAQASRRQISFSIELITPDVLSEGLEQRQIDTVIGLDSQSALPSGVIQTPWMDEALDCLAATQNHYVGKALELEQFASELHVELADISGLRPSNIENCLTQSLVEFADTFQQKAS